jgi:hypothetical protein
MNIKQTVKTLLVAVALFTAALTPFFVTGNALAVECDPATQTCCGGVPTSILACEQTGEGDIETTGLTPGFDQITVIGLADSTGARVFVAGRQVANAKHTDQRLQLVGQRHRHRRLELT